MTLSPASWPGGGSTFNGGVITTGLDIDLAADSVAETLEGVSGATNNLVEWYPDAAHTGDTSIVVDNHGQVFISSGGTIVAAKVNMADTNSGQVNLDTKDGVTINPSGANKTALTLLTTAGGNLLNTLAGLRISPNSYLVISTHAAPADAELAAGDCALWFDQTNGAAKLMVKAKQADGTVKTAAVALA